MQRRLSVRQQSRAGNYERVEVITLLNGEATKSKYFSALSRLSRPGGAMNSPAPQVSLDAGLAKLRVPEPEDAVLIYFAGHGIAWQPHFYLIPHDLSYYGQKSDAGLRAQLRDILSHAISDDELESALEQVDAGHLALILDTCASGQALEAEDKRPAP
jgi:hypothetical protein